MKKLTFLYLGLISLTIVGANNKTNNNQLQNQVINVGGVSIKIPQIDSNFVEVGDENRKNMEILVPNTNKLLSAYVLTKDFPFLSTGSNDENYMSSYAMIEVGKIIESVLVNSELFDKLVNFIGKNDIFKSDNIKESEKEINRRLETIDSSKVKIGQPTPLGCFFSKKDLYGQGNLMAYEENGTTKVKAALLILVHVKTRCIMLYIYSNYKGNDTLNWLRNIGEKWGDKILKANQSEIKRK